MPISGDKIPDKPEQQQNIGPLEPKHLSRESEGALCGGLVDTRMARNEHIAHLMLESHQIIPARNYKVIISLGTKVV